MIYRQLTLTNIRLSVSAIGREQTEKEKIALHTPGGVFQFHQKFG